MENWTSYRLSSVPLYMTSCMLMCVIAVTIVKTFTPIKCYRMQPAHTLTTVVKVYNVCARERTSGHACT